MIYRIYLRWPGQRISNKTTTEDQEIANAAYLKLIAENVGENAGAVLSVNGKTHQYIQMDKHFQTCRRCEYNGPFIDDGECCPNCRLVQ